MKKFLALLALVPSICVSESLSTYEALSEVKLCQDYRGSISCRYDLGESFDMEIAGVGGRDASIVFYKSDFDGEFYGKFGVLHGCVMVAKSENIFDIAFVSPRTGGIHRDYSSCDVYR